MQFIDNVEFGHLDISLRVLITLIYAFVFISPVTFKVNQFNVF